MAQNLMAKARLKHPTTISDQTAQINIDKHSAQYFLIEASFYHQQCLQQYQVINDIYKLGINKTEEVIELLLYLRMTSLHPSHEDLQVFAGCQPRHNLCLEQALDTLLDNRLIQKIEFLEFQFYDKNPYPHGHIFDLKTQTIKDHNSIEQLSKHQQMLTHQT